MLQTKEQHAIYMKEWRKNHPEYAVKQREYLHKFKKLHPDYVKNWDRKDNILNHERRMLNNRNYRLRHPDREAERKKKYNKRNPQKTYCRTRAGRLIPLGE